jgi:hypothetical protein
MSTDLDGDSEMMASSGSGSSVPETPTEAQTRFTGPEISPPASQKTLQPVAESKAAVSTKLTFEKKGEGKISVEGKTQHQPLQQDQPGASWMNKRAEEEYQRALEFVVDKDFNLREFGDPFDDRDMTDPIF